MPKRGIGDRAEACLVALAERERIPFVAGPRAGRGRAGDRHPVGRGHHRLRRPSSRTSAEVRDDEDAGVGDLLEAVLDRTGYLAELRDSHDPQDETRVENLAELVAVAREFDEARRDDRRGRDPRATSSSG